MTDLCRLHYLTSGNPGSPAVLFLHGFLGAGSDWEETISALSEEFYCVAPDLPGHGQTTKSSNPKAYSMNGAARALQATLDELRIAQCAVVGYSMGGRLTLYLAALHPERWTRVVVESASPGIENPSERAERQRLDEKKAEELEKGDFEAFLQSWYQQPLFESLKRDRARFQRLLGQRKNNDPLELAKSLRGMSTGAQPSLWNKLPQLEVPLLVMAGEYDTKYRQIGERLAGLCKKASFTTVSNAGHNVHVENRKEFIKQLRHFLTEQPEVNHAKNQVATKRQVQRHQIP